MVSDDRNLGDIATELILENDKVRIWNLVVAPGESSDWHLHGAHRITNNTNSTYRNVLIELK